MKLEVSFEMVYILTMNVVFTTAPLMSVVNMFQYKISVVLAASVKRNSYWQHNFKRIVNVYFKILQRTARVIGVTLPVTFK